MTRTKGVIVVGLVGAAVVAGIVATSGRLATPGVAEREGKPVGGQKVVKSDAEWRALYEDGEMTRDFVSIDDVAAALLAALDAAERGFVADVGTGRAVTGS